MRTQHLWFLAASAVILGLGPSHARVVTVHPLFDLSASDRAPFPTDRFTVSDAEQLTGRRVSLPMPLDCVANQSDCDEIALLNLLDGFHQHPRLSIPFDGPIDVSSVTNQSVFLISLGVSPEHEPMDGTILGINQIVWDTLTNTLSMRSDDSLDEQSRYALIATSRLRDSFGAALQASESFKGFRQTVRGEYKDALLEAIQFARRVGIREDDIVVASVFTTQSSTWLARRIHDQIFADDAPAADFGLGPGGMRAVYPFNQISTVTFNRQLTTGPTLTPLAMDLFPVRYRPGAIDRVAFGRFDSPDYLVHPGEYIPEIATRAGVPVRQGTSTVYFNLYLPSGSMPAGGWPVAITGHGGGGHKNFNIDSSTSIPASHGLAISIAINAVGHGLGPLSTARPVLIQMARGDQNTQNPGTSEIIRAGAFQQHTSMYRHDLFYPTVPATGTQKNPHGFPIVLRASLAPWLPIVAGAQEQIAQFLASEGTVHIVATPAAFWEVPVGIPLPETLGYIR